MSRKEPVTPSRYGKIFTVGNAKESTPNSLRKRVMSKGLITKSSSTIDEIINKSTNDNVFNTAFSQTSSGTKTPVSVNRNRSKSSTALNACYTPTSLYRSAGSTPGPTPNSAKSKVTTPANPQRRLQNGADMKTPECYSKVSLETPGRRSTKSTNNDESRKEGEISNLSVAVRVRPLNTKECLNSSVTNIVHIDRNELTVLAGTTADSSAGVSHSFQYDHAFWSCNTEDANYADQDTVFRNTAQPLVEKAFEGYNACLFAYGQTGSGKSYSMMGIETDDKEDIGPQSEAGIIPRFCQEIFRKIRMPKGKMHAQIEVSYFEIYNEKIHDLLSVTQIEASNNANSQIKKNPLKVREHPIWGPYVVDLSTHPVDSYVSLRNWLAVGNSQRATAATGMNDKSSRSHSIFNIILNLTEIGGKDSNGTNEKHTKRSKISLVDLAGSERVNHTCASGERLREGVSINKSLLTLGKVIAALADTKKGSAFVPYRESVLTWLLRENLGGNSRTVMLATISPASIHIDETLATLRYACQARTIVNRVKVNEDPHDRIIRELRAEVERLQALRQDYERQKRHSSTAPPRKIIIETSIDETEVEALRVQLAETEKELTKAQKSWMERLKEAEDLRKSEMRLLKRKGLALELSAEQKQACLINLAADPILSGTLLYILPFGTVRIGRSRPSAFSQPDIVLEGPLVAFNHCSIENTNGKLALIPENSEFETYVNGELILEKRDLFHGDRVVIGGSHYFRVSNPFCSKRHRSTAPVDYQTAHQEILQKQEEELRQELEQEKQVALRQIEEERAENERNYKEKVEMLELEKFKYNCSKELLETEKKAFKENVTHETFQYTPYKSTLLEDIKRIMQNPSKESLHKTQLKVKEATQRCRDIGINLEFKQTQVADEFGIFRAIVNIIDRKTRQKAEWPTARLDVWLELIRENEVNKDNIFNSVDIEWSPLNESLDETLNDSLNSSRISLNLSSVKDAILRRNNFQNNSKNSSNAPKSPQETKRQNLSKVTLLKSVACKNIENTKKMLTYDDDDDTPTTSKYSPAAGFNTTAYGYLKDIQRSTLKLKRFCESYNYDENSREKRPPIDYVMKSVDQLEEMIYDIKIVLTEQKMTGSPPKTPKSVRFLLD